MRSIKIKIFGVLLAAALFIISGESILFAQEIPISKKLNTEKDEKEKLPTTKKDLKGVVVDMLSGETIADATVSLLDKSVKTDKDGKFLFKEVDEYHPIQMTARIMTDLDIVIGCSYFFVPTTYYPISANKENKSDIQIIDMNNHDKEIILKVGDYSKDNIDKYCEKCHEGSPCLVEEEYGMAANGKKKLRGLLVRQSELDAYVEKMKKETLTIERYANIRYSDSHPKSVDITATDSFEEARLVLPEDMVLKDDKIIICDTCHTRHIPTEWGQFVVMDFMQQESICVKCHK